MERVDLIYKLNRYYIVYQGFRDMGWELGDS
jgi:hypothetical protein